MRDYILRRLILLIPIMFGVTFLTFLAYRVIPGNAAVLTCGLDCSPQVIKDLEHEYGLDRPWYEQYVGWLWDVAHGDLGRSFAYNIAVTTELGRRVPITVAVLVLIFVLDLVPALGGAAVLMRRTRCAMPEVLRNGSLRTAWSKGLRERSVVWRHALKNAIIPIVTVIGLQIGGLLGGAVIVESLYNLN